jgi:hypothetical protein
MLRFRDMSAGCSTFIIPRPVHHSWVKRWLINRFLAADFSFPRSPSIAIAVSDPQT